MNRLLNTSSSTGSTDVPAALLRFSGRAQRKPLDKEAEFYRGKPMPSWLKSKIDASDAQLAASAEILKSREQELKYQEAMRRLEQDVARSAALQGASTSEDAAIGKQRAEPNDWQQQV